MTDNREQAARFAQMAETAAKNAGVHGPQSSFQAALASTYASLAIYYLLLSSENDD